MKHKVVSTFLLVILAVSLFVVTLNVPKTTYAATTITFYDVDGLNTPRANNTVVSLPTLFSANVSTTSGTLSHYIFSHDNAILDTMVNETAVAISGTSYTVNHTLTLNNTDRLVHWKFYANNTVGTWNNTGLQTMQTFLTNQFKHNSFIIYDQPWVYMQKSVLSTGLDKMIADLTTSKARQTAIFVGYWNAVIPTAPVPVYFRTEAFYKPIINKLHAINNVVYAWIEDGGTNPAYGTMNISASNYANIYSAIHTCMDYGFDGYFDDIETWAGKAESTTIENENTQINWLNNVTIDLHSYGKLSMPAVEYDWTQRVNNRLQVDFIWSMFYGGHSTFEDSQAAAYWQENLGIYGKNEPPKSPLILGIMNARSPYNQYPIVWQLAKAEEFYNAYTHVNLTGWGIWVLEYMGTTTDDWQQWNYWIPRINVTASTKYQVNIDSSPPTAQVAMNFQGGTYTSSTQYTPFTRYTFVPINVTTEASTIGVTHSVTFGETRYNPTGSTYNVYTYWSGHYNITSPKTINSLYVYCKANTNVKLSIYNATNYHIDGWVGIDFHPHKLLAYSSATACSANTWNLVSIPSTYLSTGAYFIGIKASVSQSIGWYGNSSSYWYGRGQWITQSYATTWDATAPQPSGATGSSLTNYVAFAAPEEYVFNFAHWEDDSTNPTRTGVTFTSSPTYLVATYTIGSENSVVLNQPTNDATSQSRDILFNYTVTFYGSDIQNSSIWANVSGTWQRVAWNTTTITNGTIHTIGHTFTVDATYIWNIQVFNSTSYVFAISNFTLSITTTFYDGGGWWGNWWG